MDNENDISPSTSKDAKKTKKIKGVDILTSIKKNIEEDVEYSLDDLKKLVSNFYKKCVKKSSNVVKLRQENPDKEYKDLMKLVADKWNEKKKAQ